MHIDLDAVQQAITLFQTDGNTYVHNDMGITNPKAKSLMERSEVIVFGFLETEDKDEDGNEIWEVVDCINALIQDIRTQEGYLSEAEKLFFLMHGYSVLMDNLDHIPVIDFDMN